MMPEIEEEYKQNIDDMIKMELDNLRIINFGTKKGKGKGKKKGGKKKKKGKGKKKKWPKLPGIKYVKE